MTNYRNYYRRRSNKGSSKRSLRRLVREMAGISGYDYNPGTRLADKVAAKLKSDGVNKADYTQDEIWGMVFDNLNGMQPPQTKHLNDPDFFSDVLQGLTTEIYGMDDMNYNSEDKMTMRESKMKITKRHLKSIIREEYSRLKRQGLISESNYSNGAGQAQELIEQLSKLMYRGVSDEEITSFLRSQDMSLIQEAIQIALEDGWEEIVGLLRNEVSIRGYLDDYKNNRRSFGRQKYFGD